MRANQHDLIAQHGILAGNLRDDVVAVRVGFLIGRAKLEPKLRRDTRLHHPDDHVVVLGHDRHLRHRIVRRRPAAGDEDGSVSAVARTQNRAGAEALEEHVERVRGHGRLRLPLGRRRGAADSHGFIRVSRLQPVRSDEDRLRRRRQDDRAAEFLAERLDLGGRFVANIDRRAREHALGGRRPRRRKTVHREVSRRRQLECELLQLPSAAEWEGLEVRVGESPSGEAIADVVRRLLVRLAAREARTGDVGDVVEGLENLRPVGRLRADARDHGAINRFLRGQRAGCDNDGNENSAERQANMTHGQPQEVGVENDNLRDSTATRCAVPESDPASWH